MNTTTCYGCQNNCPGQLSHMDIGGCLYTESEPIKIIKKEPEPEPDSDEDEAVVEMSVVEVEYDGKTYYHDENTDSVYDPETSEIVGTRVDGKIQFE